MRLGLTQAEPGDLARFLALIGTSGSGKSSVVRAGLVPALRKGGLPKSEQWFFTDVHRWGHWTRTSADERG